MVPADRWAGTPAPVFVSDLNEPVAWIMREIIVRELPALLAVGAEPCRDGPPWPGLAETSYEYLQIRRQKSSAIPIWIQ